MPAELIVKANVEAEVIEVEPLGVADNYRVRVRSTIRFDGREPLVIEEDHRVEMVPDGAAKGREEVPGPLLTG